MASAISILICLQHIMCFPTLNHEAEHETQYKILTFKNHSTRNTGKSVE